MSTNCVTFAVEYLGNRGLVPKDHQYEMTYRESNGHVSNPWHDVIKDKFVTPIRL